MMNSKRQFLIGLIVLSLTPIACLGGGQTGNLIIVTAAPNGQSGSRSPGAIFPQLGGGNANRASEATITSPSPGDLLDPSSFTVNGIGGVEPGDSVTVEVRDPTDRLLAQQSVEITAAMEAAPPQEPVEVQPEAQPTPAEPVTDDATTEDGGEAETAEPTVEIPPTADIAATPVPQDIGWSVTMSVDYGGEATISVFVTPANGDASIALGSLLVLFVSEDVRFISITAPGSDAQLNPIAFTVSGDAGALPDNALTVEVLNATGGVIVQQSTEIDVFQLGPNNSGPWLLDMSISYSGSATIRAYARSLENGAILAEDTVQVNFRSDLPQFVTITSPQEGDYFNPASFTVAGDGGGLPGGSLTVQLLAADGSILAEDITTLNSPDAINGGQGQWSITLSASGSGSATIRAFSTSPLDGSIVAQDEIDVTLLE